MYGIDSDLGVPDCGEDEEGVEVPPTELDLSPENISELQSIVNPLSECEEFGIDLFMQTLHYTAIYSYISMTQVLLLLSWELKFFFFYGKGALL